MSNPLLRPNDPRFRKPELRDESGTNPFAEPGAKPAEAGPQPAGDVFAATADERPYQPKYEAQQQSRGGLLLLLGATGWLAAFFGVLSMADVVAMGWIGPLIGVAPAGAAWFLAYEELKAVRHGAIDIEARSRLRSAFWLGLLGLLACLAIIAAMIYQQMNFLPDLV
jgi:hypothetical protein